MRLRYLALAIIPAILLAGSAMAQQSRATGVYTGPPDLLALSNSSMNSSSINSSLVNSTVINSTARENNSSAYLVSSEVSEVASAGKEVMDLSNYARDRSNKSLAGYRNVMYPITGSRGSTTSTSGGGGGGGGCGCG